MTATDIISHARSALEYARPALELPWVQGILATYVLLLSTRGNWAVLSDLWWVGRKTARLAFWSLRGTLRQTVRITGLRAWWSKPSKGEVAATETLRLAVERTNRLEQKLDDLLRTLPTTGGQPVMLVPPQPPSQNPCSKRGAL